MTRKPITGEPAQMEGGFQFAIDDSAVTIIRAAETITPAEGAVASLVRVRIMKRFMLCRQDRTTQVFDPKESNCGLPGYYDVSAEDAAHPYLQANTDNPPPVIVQPGTLVFAEEQKRELRRQHVQRMIEKQQENDAVAEIRRQNLAGLRERMGGDQSGLEDPNT